MIPEEIKNIDWHQQRMSSSMKWRKAPSAALRMPWTIQILCIMMKSMPGNSKYGSIIAPPGFFGWPLKQARNSPLAVDIPIELEAAFEQAGYPLSLVLDGGMEYEFFLPVHAGDILTGGDHRS